MEEKVEEELITKIRAGDVQSLGDFLELHRSRMLGFIKSITGDHLLARIDLEDLYQEVATGAIAALPRMNSGDLDPLPWLQQLARRRVIDAHRFYFGAERRAAGRETSLEAAVSGNSEGLGLHQLLIASITSPSAAVSRDFRLARVAEALQSLTEEQQSIIRLRYVDGLPTKEIAEKIGKTDAAIRVILTRSVRKLEEMLGES